jgi:hypothetical protein
VTNALKISVLNKILFVDHPSKPPTHYTAAIANIRRISVLAGRREGGGLSLGKSINKNTKYFTTQFNYVWCEGHGYDTTSICVSIVLISEGIKMCQNINTSEEDEVHLEIKIRYEFCIIL